LRWNEFAGAQVTVTSGNGTMVARSARSQRPGRLIGCAKWQRAADSGGTVATWYQQTFSADEIEAWLGSQTRSIAHFADV
jgi:hypothetical protein